MTWNNEDLVADRPRLSKRSSPKESSGIVAAVAVTAVLVIGTTAAHTWWQQASEPQTASREQSQIGARQAVDLANPAVTNAQAQSPTVPESIGRTQSASPDTQTEPPEAGQATAMADSPAADVAAAVAYAAGRGAGELVRPLAQGYVDAGVYDVPCG